MKTWMRKALGTTVVLSVALATSSALAGGGPVNNGDFEKPDAGSTWITYSKGETFKGWTVARGSIDLIGELWQAATGKQSIDLAGFSEGAISQVVVTTPGQPYLLTFALAGNPDPACGPLEIRHMRVRFDGAIVGVFSFDPTGHSTEDMGWVTESIEVVPKTDRTTLRFRGLDGGCAGAAIDSVQLQPA